MTQIEWVALMTSAPAVLPAAFVCYELAYPPQNLRTFVLAWSLLAAFALTLVVTWLAASDGILKANAEFAKLFCEVGASEIGMTFVAVSGAILFYKSWKALRR